MHVMLLCENYPPEMEPTWPHELAAELAARRYRVTTLTAFPNRGQPRVYEGYRGKVFQREMMDGVQVVRSWVYATASKKFYPRAMSYSSFCVSSLFAGLFAVSRPDVIYVVIPFLPLGVTAALLAFCKRARLIVNVQDIFPRAAVEHGVLENRLAIRFFERMEHWIYRRADHVTVISEGMREDLVGRGVPSRKVSVVENWADPDFIVPGPKDNAFRRELGAEGRFVVVYSGGINNNANLGPLLHAAEILRGERFLFAIVGDGQYKPELQQLAQKKSLDNVKFFPFQPLARYPDVLRAADLNFVSLSVKSATCSVPSKIYKQMAAGRPILAATPQINELFRIVTKSNCGKCVPPDDPVAIANAVRWAQEHPVELARMGENARRYLEQHDTIRHGVDRVCEVLHKVTGSRAGAPLPPRRSPRLLPSRLPRVQGQSGHPSAVGATPESETHGLGHRWRLA